MRTGELAAVAAVICLVSGSAEAGIADCASGYRFDRMSGVGCVQDKCRDVSHAFYSYVGYCVCYACGEAGCSGDKAYSKECRRPQDYASCPGCLYACIGPEDICPGEERVAASTNLILSAAAPVWASPPLTANESCLKACSSEAYGAGASSALGKMFGEVVAAKPAGCVCPEAPTIEECREDCLKTAGTYSVPVIDQEHGSCMCECVEGYGYTYDGGLKCVDCQAFCSRNDKFMAYDPRPRSDASNENQFLCHCWCNEWSKPTASKCKPNCPKHSTPGEGDCVCDEGYEMKGKQCISTKVCSLGESCVKDDCRCPDGMACDSADKYADVRGCVTSYCRKDGVCSQKDGESCRTCEVDCGCDTGLSCFPGDPGADGKGCLKAQCNNDGKKDSGENCRHCADASCEGGQQCFPFRAEDGGPKWVCLVEANYVAKVKSLNGDYVYVNRQAGADRFVPLRAGDKLMEGDRVLLRRMPGDPESTHVLIEWGDGRQGLAWLNWNSDVNQGSFYVGVNRQESAQYPRYEERPDGTLVDKTERAFPPEETYIGLNSDEWGDVGLYVGVELAPDALALLMLGESLPNALTVPIGMLIRPDSLGHRPMTFVNVKSKVMLQPTGNWTYDLYTFEGAPEVLRLDEYGVVTSAQTVGPGEKLQLSAYATPSKPVKYGPGEVDRFWVGSEPAGDVLPEEPSEDAGCQCIPSVTGLISLLMAFAAKKAF